MARWAQARAAAAAEGGAAAAAGPVVLVGHSFGGGAVLKAAERLGKLSRPRQVPEARFVMPGPPGGTLLCPLLRSQHSGGSLTLACPQLAGLVTLATATCGSGAKAADPRRKAADTLSLSAAVNGAGTASHSSPGRLSGHAADWSSSHAADWSSSYAADWSSLSGSLPAAVSALPPLCLMSYPPAALPPISSPASLPAALPPSSLLLCLLRFAHMPLGRRVLQGRRWQGGRYFACTERRTSASRRRPPGRSTRQVSAQLKR